MSIANRLAALFLLLGSSFAPGQSTTQENLGVITAPQAFNGLGWQVGSTNEQEFAAAADAGAKHVRLDSCIWSEVEEQSAPPNNVSNGYTLPAACASGLTFAKKYGLSPTVIASYGAPYHTILSLTLSAPAAVGDTSLSVEYTSSVGGQTLSSIAYPNDYIVDAAGDRLSNRYSYSGTLIIGTTLSSGTTATINLASGLKLALPSGTTMNVNEILYPSAIAADATDPSIMAFARYAEYLAGQIKAYGMTGEVEIWNEPPWGEDCWDNRHDCYDTDPKLPNELPGNSPNFGLAAALQTTVPVAGVNYVWAGTNKSASADLLGSNMLKFSGTPFIQPQQAITEESMHPYGSNPEDAMWNQPCIVANPKAYQHCNTIIPLYSNMVIAEATDLLARETSPANGINHSITETGAASLFEDNPHLARYVTRQFFGFLADDFSYVDFYRLSDTSIPGQTGFSFIILTNNNTSYTPLQNYTALAGIMADLAPMQEAPVADVSASTLPSVTSYVGGTYNLDSLSIVGSRPGDTANSIMYVLYQRSYVDKPCGYGYPCWGTVLQPADAQTSVTIPSGLKVYQVINADTREAVDFTQTGATVTLGVSDDPIELLFIPASDTSTPVFKPTLVFADIANQTQGNSVTLSASSISKGTITYSVASGPATISGPTVTTTGPGTVVVKASQAANADYAAATATSSFTVAAVTPSLNFGVITSKSFGVSFGVSATSVSKGAVTYSVVSGPATISGATVTSTDIGTVVLEAVQAANGIYTAATATTSFQVFPIAPTLVFTPIPGQTFGDVLTVSATSNSSGAITYSIVKGPATISGATVSFTNVGQVFVQASIAASGGYTAATTTTQFHVSPAVPVLVFASIPSSQPYKTSFTVSASSASTGTIIYSIVSGPARISGSTVTTLSTTGTVVVKAAQVVSGGYNSASATTSFSVVPTITPTLTFASIPSPVTVGTVFTVSATSVSPGAITYSIASGPATISGATVTATGAGTVVVHASQAASEGYTAATASASFTAAAQALTFVTIPTENLGKVFTVSAESISPGAITYSVVSGPATIAGSTVTPTAIGTVVVKAHQAASGIFPAATTTVGVSVAGYIPAMAFVPISPKSFGATLQILATSNSTAAVTYSVDSGPAIISGRTITTDGSGTVVLRATQPASGNYAAGATTTSFYVAPDRYPLKFTPISPKTKGDVVVVKASSDSPGAITYSVTSGSATISGSTVTMDGSGTVVLEATQAGSGVWPAATTTISFPVSP